MSNRQKLLNFIKQGKSVNYDTVSFFVRDYLDPYRMATAERTLRQAQQGGLLKIIHGKDGVVVEYTWIDLSTSTYEQFYDKLKVDKEEGVDKQLNLKI